MMNKILNVVIFIVFCLVMTSICRAEQVCIVGNEYKPPKIYAVKGEAKGILIEIARYIDERMPSHDLKYDLVPWCRAYNKALAGEVGIIGLSMTSERLESFDYSEVIFYDEVVLVVKRGNEFSFTSIEDLRGKKVGIGRGGTFGDDFDNAVKSGLFQLHEDNGDPLRLRMLLAERIDVAFISPGRIALDKVVENNQELKRHRDDFVVLPTPFKRDANYLGFAKTMNMKAFLKEFNLILRQGKASGDIQRIIIHHDCD